jgi:hypothetical protein
MSLLSTPIQKIKKLSLREVKFQPTPNRVKESILAQPETEKPSAIDRYFLTDDTNIPGTGFTNCLILRQLDNGNFEAENVKPHDDDVVLSRRFNDWKKWVRENNKIIYILDATKALSIEPETKIS